jgi:lysophospholipase L1-like esterase
MRHKLTREQQIAGLRKALANPKTNWRQGSEGTTNHFEAFRGDRRGPELGDPWAARFLAAPLLGYRRGSHSFSVGDSPARTVGETAVKQFFLLAGALICLAAPARAQIYDLPCPAPTSVLASYQTINPVNGHLKAYLCVDAQGNVTSPSLGGIAYPAVANTFSDLFNRGGANLGANWTNYQNGWVPNNGAAHGTNASGGSNVAAYTGVSYGTTAGSAEACRFVMTVAASGDSPGCALRIGGTAGTSANYYLCFNGTTTGMGIIKVVGGTSASNGTVTILASTSTNGAAGDVVNFVVVGNTLTCNKNHNAIILQANDASSPLTSGFAGVYQGGNTATSASVVINPYVLPASATANIVLDGDSITTGDGPTPSSMSSSYGNYLRISGAGSAPYVRNVSVDSKGLGVGIAAISAGTVETMIATGTSVVDPMFVSGIPNLVVIWGCTNDIAIGGRTPAQCITDMTTYVANRHAAGWKVLVVPALSRNIAGDPSLQILNQSLNTVGADGVVALPPSLVNTTSWNDTQLFQSDGIHPSELASDDVIANAISAAINQVAGF